MLIYYTLPKNTKIILKFLNKTIRIYNGNKYYDLVIKKNMIGYKLGDFITTRSKYVYKKKK